MQQLMRNYTYQKYGEQDAYGQPTLGEGGTISMAISVISNQIGDNVMYRDAQYIGLTKGSLDDKCVINYGTDKLKVLYVIPGRFNQVYMTRCE